MAHFAKINENNIVEQVIVINDNELLDGNGIEQESLGINFCKSLFGENTNWVQTSYNTFGGVHKLGGTAFRKNYAGVGDTWRQDLDGFVSPSFYPSWILNEETCLWESPIGNPPDNKYYIWNEQSQTWDLAE
jgi:hypothetical protein